MHLNQLVSESPQNMGFFVMYLTAAKFEVCFSKMYVSNGTKYYQQPTGKIFSTVAVFLHCDFYGGKIVDIQNWAQGTCRQGILGTV